MWVTAAHSVRGCIDATSSPLGTPREREPVTAYNLGSANADSLTTVPPE